MMFALKCVKPLNLKKIMHYKNINAFNRTLNSKQRGTFVNA